MKKTQYITIRTDEKTKIALERIANKEDRTLSYIINKILTQYVEKGDGIAKYESFYESLIGVIYAAEELDHIINTEQRTKLIKEIQDLKEEIEEITENED